MMGVRGYLTSYARLFEDRTDDAPMLQRSSVEDLEDGKIIGPYTPQLCHSHPPHRPEWSK